MTPLEWAAVGGIGGASALARFVVDGIIATTVGSDFPAGTLGVNASGAFLLGLLTGLALSGESLLPLRHSFDRLVHDVLDLDARDPTPERGR